VFDQTNAQSRTHDNRSYYSKNSKKSQLKTDTNLKQKLEDYKRRMMRGIKLSPDKPKRRHSKPENRSKTFSPEKTNTGNRHLKKRIYAEIKAGGTSNEYLP
jgi:hypothetical protein